MFKSELGNHTAMILKVFDVAHGSANLIISPTGKTELVDLGSRSDFSPLDHIYSNYVPNGGRIDRLVLTHHHGDHLDDVFNLTTQRMPGVVLRRHLTGQYEEACRNSNAGDGQKKAKHFDTLFASYDSPASSAVTSSEAWGISRTTWFSGRNVSGSHDIYLQCDGQLL